MDATSHNIYLDGLDELIRALLIELDYDFSHFHWKNSVETNTIAYRSILEAYQASRIVKNKEVRSTMAYVLKAIAESITNNERLNLNDLLFPEGKESNDET